MLGKIKNLLGISAEDTTLDEKLQLIITMAVSRLKLRLGGIEPPEEMNHIIIEVSIVRYNRIGSEGLSSHTVEGESLTFSDDFAPYEEEIQAFLNSQKLSTFGKVRFI